MSSVSFNPVNAACLTAFGQNYPCLYFPTSPPALPGTQFTIYSIPIDPIRKEGAQPGNLVVRFMQQADFLAQGVVPQRGDQLQAETGDVYSVEDVQLDAGGGYSFMLKKDKRRNQPQV